MGTNRTQPFGYRMEFGKVVIDPDEARWVAYIYEKYVLGESFKSLSDTLCGAGVRYDVDKPWNKNMVARILQDRRYVGEGRYPKIVESSIFQKVDQKRSKKAHQSQVTKVQKILKKKSRARVTPGVECEVLHLLNGLAGKPERIEIPDNLTKTANRVEALQAEIEELLRMLPVGESKAREKLMETTTAMYETIDPRKYETQRLKCILGNAQVRSDLDANILEQCVSAVIIDSLGKVRIKLKNGQMIERGMPNE